MINKLELLEKQVQKELAMIRYPDAPWVMRRQHPSGQSVYDVIVIGAGQGGLTAAFALMRERISNILVLEKNSYGKEGPWGNYARMKTLRSPKHFNGPDLDIPSLTCQAWYEACFGEKAWDAIEKIPKEHWQAYLLWYRQVLNIPVLNQTNVIKIIPEKNILALQCLYAGKIEFFYTRKIVLATGIDGNGAWYAPEFIKRLPPHCYSLASNTINFKKLRYKDVAIIGGGASAFDNAAIALEHGAKSVHLYIRRSALHRVNPHKWTEFNGFLNHFTEANDYWRWKFMQHIILEREPVPNETFLRTIKYANFHLYLDSAVLNTHFVNNKIHVITKRNDIHFDFLIVATGIVIDLSLCQELSEFVSHIALWKDFRPVADAHPALDRFPYLGPHFEFVEKYPGKAPYLKNIYNFTAGATLSHGPSGSSINGMKHAVRKIVKGISKDFFMEDIEHYYRDLAGFDKPELEIPWPVKLDKNYETCL